MIITSRFNSTICLLGGTLLACLLVAAPAQAVRVQALYSTELLVAQQSMQVEPALGGKALAQVLVKVSGRPDILDAEPITAAMAAPQRYIQQFSYHNAGISRTNGAGQEVPAQRLKIDFIPVLVDQLLSQSGYRTLGAERPGVLVWIVEERSQRREFLGREEDPVFAPMRERARQRGLPIFRPLMDLEDQNALSVADAWGFFDEPVQAASSRYQADAILVGRLYPAGGGWRSRWMLLRNGERSQFEGAGTTLDEHLSAAVDQTAERVFADFVAPVGDLQQGVLIEIGGVNRFDDYAQVMQYLREVTVVRDVALSEQNAAVLTLSLQLNGSLKQLESAIALNNRFHLQPERLLPFSDARLSYRWGD